MAGRRGEDVEIQGLGPVRIELLGMRETQEVESDTYQSMKHHGLEIDGVTAERYELERATRALARAVRDPADRTRAFGTLAEWEQLDNTLINAAWLAYGDVRERLDPLSVPATEAERTAIELAVKKNDAILLRSFGVVRLAGFMLSSAAPPSISPDPNSSSSASSSES